ncbi:MAG: SAM-dependent methyltransferase [Bacteroidaceae bacterium]|nr:SAM-dependent methyltransferase [Bacteroidaceae bacterium]
MIDEHTLAFIREHTGDDVRQLALQAARYPLVDMRVAATQIEGRRLAAAKLPAWAATDGVMYPVRLSMEQCSSEATARYKASLVGGSRLADLTGGFGIDCSYMSERFDEATYIERNEELCRIARHNFGLLGLPIRVVNGNSAEVLPSMPVQDWIFLDPARRDGVGNKVVALSDCEPDVCQLEKLLLQKAVRVMVKCSPMLDISLAISQLTSVREVHVVSVGNECKELLLILGGTTGHGIEVRTVNFHGSGVQTFDYALEEEQAASCSYTSTVGRYLYEPNSSMMKAGCFRLPAGRYGLQKLHRNTHLYTSDTLVPDFPGRVFEVKNIDGFGKNELKLLSSELKKANIAVRNFPERPEALRKRLKLADGGDVYLFATTLADEKRVIIRCVKA